MRLKTMHDRRRRKLKNKIKAPKLLPVFAYKYKPAKFIKDLILQNVLGAKVIDWVIKHDNIAPSDFLFGKVICRNSFEKVEINFNLSDATEDVAGKMREQKLRAWTEKNADGKQTITYFPENDDFEAFETEVVE